MKVLLFYKYVSIADPAALVADMQAFCKAHNLLGRILIATEGINGTCAGNDADVDAYKTYMHAKSEFSDLWFKEQPIENQPFPRLAIRIRPELVTLRIEGLDPQNNGCKHLSPTEVNTLIESGEAVMFDARNEIESRIGKFKDAIVPNIKTFRDLPSVLPQYSHLKDKKIIMYCTGGIRCEKASALLKKEGFSDVYQIDGGIYNYCQQYPDGYFQGTCFVFDDRMQIGWGNDHAVKLEQEMPKDRIISNCEFCDVKTARVVNDERLLTRLLRVCCESCDKKLDMSRMRTDAERQVMLIEAAKAQHSQSASHTQQKPVHAAAKPQDSSDAIN